MLHRIDTRSVSGLRASRLQDALPGGTRPPADAADLRIPPAVVVGSAIVFAKGLTQFSVKGGVKVDHLDGLTAYDSVTC